MRKIPRGRYFFGWRRLVVGAVCVALAVCLFATQIPILWRCMRSGSYIETTCQITSPPKIDSSIGSFVRGVLLLGDRTEVLVEYTFEVDGRAYIGTRLFEHGNTVFGTGSRGSYVQGSPAASMIQDLTERPEVSVY